MAPSLHPGSLRRQLLVRLTAPLVLLLLLGAFGAYRYALHYANQAFDNWLNDSARALAQQVKLAGGRASLDLPKAAIEIFEWDSLDRTYYAVTADRQGVVFSNADFPAPPGPLPDSRSPIDYDAVIEGRPVRVSALAMPMDATRAGRERVVIQVAETMGKRNAMASEMLLAIIVPQGLLLIAALAVIGLGVSGGLRPLAELAEQIRKRHSGDLRPLQVEAPVEVAPLTAALNRLFAELDEAQRSQQRFIADAAHQLRTPLATLQVQAERALRERDPAAGAEAVRHVLIATQRLGHLVHQLLTLARAEPASVSALERCDLAALAREAAADWVPAALERDVDLGYSGPDGAVPVTGNPLLLRELINNLVDNALKYGRSAGLHSHVTVGVDGGPAVRLWVEDNGPGIPAEAREQVLERFVRLGASQEAGCGLGLSIVREIAARHGATVSVEVGSQGAGTRIVVRFAGTPAPAAVREMPAERVGAA